MEKNIQEAYGQSVDFSAESEPVRNMPTSEESAKITELLKIGSSNGVLAQRPAPISIRNTPAIQDFQAMRTMLQNIPDGIKQNGRFCLWRYEERSGTQKPAKVPYNPSTGQKADVSDPSTFGTFDEAMAHLTPDFNGIGIRVDGPISALDLDNCRDGQGNLSPMAADIVRTMDCYTEVSPSGRGIRLLFSVPPGYAFDKSRYYINNQKIGAEAYISGSTTKYVTVTGNTLTPGVDLVQRDSQLQLVLDKYMTRPSAEVDPATVATVQPQPAAGQPYQTADQVMQLIQNSRSAPLFWKLFSGDMSDYGNDHSKADMAFCNIVAAFTKDPAIIDAIVRRSKLMRPKWDSLRGNTTYGQMTVDNAIRTALRYAHVQAVAAQQPALRADQPIPASELMKLDLPAPAFLVEDMLIEGTTTILASAPKVGKSWFSLGLGVSVAGSEKFLDHDTTQGGVLYLALEDGARRLQNRLKKMLGGKPAPDNLYLQTAAPTLLGGLLEALDEVLKAHPEIKLVIIDTLQMVRSIDSAGSYSYSNDYIELGLFKKYSETRRIALVLVHHVRKSKDEDNPFNDIAGSNGIMGAVDAAMVLSRKRGDTEATLNITGRDVPETTLTIALDKETMRWESLGDAEALRQEREKQAFLNDPLVQTVYELTCESQSHAWGGQASELVAAGAARNRDLGNPQTVGYQLRKYANGFRTYLGIKYDAEEINGNAGKRHTFELYNSADPNESE